MNRSIFVLGLSIGFSVLALGAARAARADEPKLPADGWVSWEVPATDGAPFWCCWSNWEKNAVTREPCKLDERPNGYGYGSRDNETTDAVRVYAHSKGGKLDRLRVFAAACPVKTRTPVRDIANVSPDDSARWLVAQAKTDGIDSSTREALMQHALAGLAMHRGDVAGKSLTDFSRTDPREEARKQATFWLAQMRGEEGAAAVSSVMFHDEDPEVRKHGAFAMTQTKSARAAPDLIKLGNSDKDADVRAQAWFWLAQGGYAEAEAAISAAVRKDADDHVREQAVFALSQLPDDRAVKALIAAAEDQSLTREQRKRAVFWLSQSDSDAAQKYLENVLARAAN